MIFRYVWMSLLHIILIVVIGDCYARRKLINYMSLLKITLLRSVWLNCGNNYHFVLHHNEGVEKTKKSIPK